MGRSVPDRAGQAAGPPWGRAALLRRWSLTGYFIATFAFSWLFWLPAAVIYGGDAGRDALASSPGFIILQSVGAAGPSLVAIVFILTLYGRERLKQTLRAYLRWRVGARLLALSTLLVPLITAAAIGLQALVDGDRFTMSPTSPLGEIVNDVGWGGLLLALPLIFLSQLFSSPLLEELGWRGFALPQLQDRLNALSASVLLGLVWGLWHLPLILVYGDPLPLYLVGITAHSILFTWLFNSSGGSLLVALLVHASLNVSLNVLAIDGNDWLAIALTWLVVAAVVGRYGPRDLARVPRIRWQAPPAATEPAGHSAR